MNEILPTLQSDAAVRVLVADDEELDRLAVVRILNQSSLNLQVEPVASVEEMLERIAAEHFDVLLLDYYFPGVDTSSLIESIIDTAPDLPIVAFTGRGDEEIAVQLMKAGASDYLPKASLTPERLGSTIRHALELAAQQRARRQSEEELRTEEARFRTLANTISQLAWMGGPDGARYWFNQRWYDFTGATFEEVKDWGWQKLHHPDHVQRVVEGLRRAIATGESWEDTFPLQGKEGIRWFLGRAEPIRSGDGTISGWLGTNTDITDLREAEEAAAEASRQRDAFIVTVTHDLRNPLTIVKGYSRVLLRSSAADVSFDKQTLAQIGEAIESAADRMAKLIDEMLDASQIAAGHRLELNLGEVDLVELLQQVVKEQQSLAAIHTIRLETGLPQLVCTTDRARMDRVLSNLISNAVKFSPQGGDVVVALEQSGDAALMRVVDQGIGIPAGDLSTVFERYQRGRNVKHRISGYGLGLAGVRDVLTMLGGSIAVESTEGKGSTFTVRLPLNGSDDRQTDA